MSGEPLRGMRECRLHGKGWRMMWTDPDDAGHPAGHPAAEKPAGVPVRSAGSFCGSQGCSTTKPTKSGSLKWKQFGGLNEIGKRFMLLRNVPFCLSACEGVEVIAHNNDFRDSNRQLVVCEQGPVLIVCCPKQLLAVISLWVIVKKTCRLFLK